MNKYFEQIVESIKGFFARIGVDEWFAKMNIDSTEVVRGGLTLFGGMFLGVLSKKYFKIMFVTTVVTVAVIKGLEYQNLLTLDYTGFKNFIGVDQAITLNSLAGDIFGWIKGNLVAAVCLVIGLLIGLKIG